MPPEVNSGGHSINAITASSDTNLCNAFLNSANEINKISNDINSIQRDLDNDTFWSKYSIHKSPADGHCFMHSVAFCLSHIPNYFGANVDMLSKKLKNETLMNEKLYGDYIDGGIQALRNGVTDYLCHKLYDTSYGDIIPNIMSNAIMTNLLLIIEHEGSHSLQLIKCIDEYRHTLLLYKRGEHYDAIIPVNAS